MLQSLAFTCYNMGFSRKFSNSESRFSESGEGERIEDLKMF